MFLPGFSLPSFADEALTPPTASVTTVAPKQPDYGDSRAPSGNLADVPLPPFGNPLDGITAALQKIPGTQLQRTSSSGHTSLLRIRGGNARQIGVYLDNIRWSNNFGIGFDIGRLQVLGLGSMRIFFGPAAAAFGNSALTGAVAISSKRPTINGLDVSVTTGFGSFGTMHLGSELTYLNNDLKSLVGFWGAAGVGYFNSNGDFTFIDEDPHLPDSDVRRVNNDVAQTTAYGSAGVRFAHHNIAFHFRWFNGAKGMAGPAQFQEALGEARGKESNIFSVLTYRRQRPWKWGKVEFEPRISLGFQRDRSHYNNPSSLIGATKVEVSQSANSAHVVAGSDLWWPIFGGPEDTVSLETTLRADYRFSFETLVSHEEGFTHDDIDVRRSSHTVVVSDSLMLICTVCFTTVELFGGVQFFSMSDRDAESHWFPFAGADLRYREMLGVKGNVARTYRAPNFDELYNNGELVKGDPELLDEFAAAWDVTVYLAGKYDDFATTLSTTYFSNNIENGIHFLPVSAYQYRAQNLDRMRNRGVTAEAELAWRWLSLEGRFTYTEASLAEVSAPAPGVAPYVGGGSVSADITSLLRGVGVGSEVVDSVRLSLSGSYRSAMTLDRFGSIRTGSSLTFDGELGCRIGGKLELLVELRNMGDVRNRVNLFDRPLPGRTLYVTLRLDRLWR